MSQANNHTSRYTVIEAQCWHNTVNGARFLAHIRAPGGTNLEAWRLEPAGWTIKDTHTGEIGYGRKPFPERQDADSFAARLNEIQAQADALCAGVPPPRAPQDEQPQKKHAPVPRARQSAPPVRNRPVATSYLL